MLQRLICAVVPCLLAACAHNPPLTFDAGLRHVVPRPYGLHSEPTDGTDRLGFAPLESSALPPGEREIRLEIDCGGCTPKYVFRIRTADHRAVGEAYLLEGHFAPDPGDTAGARQFREVEARNDSDRRVFRCGPWIRRGDGELEGCRIGAPINWHHVLRLLDQSGVLRAVVDTGYDPEPPGYRFIKPGGRDPVTGVDLLPIVQRPPCRDITGESLFIEMLDGIHYGTATFSCLDVHGPPGTEHDRARRLRDQLANLLPRPTWDN